MTKTNPIATGKSSAGAKSPSIVRFLLIHAGIGSIVAVGIVTALILTDTHSLGKLIMADQDPVIAVVLLMFGFIITFGSVAMGAAIMGLPYGDGSGRKGRRISRREEAAPAGAVQITVSTRS